MNIVNERQSDSIHQLRFEFTKEDYAEKVESALKIQRKKALVPGFRPGNAPMGLIKKMYEKSITINEVNNLITDSLSQYLEDNEVKFMLEPMTVNDKTNIDFDKNENFVITFEYALYPEFEIDYSTLPAVKYFTVEASENEIEGYIKKLRERHGSYISPETIENEDYVNVKYDEKDGFFYMTNLTDEGKEAFTGKKVNDVVEISLKAIFSEKSSLSNFLKIKESEIEEENPYNCSLTITMIGRTSLAELNDEFFAKAFPEGNVKNEKELKEFAAKEVENLWKEETDRHFMNEAVNVLLSDVKIDLPDDFIKRYILINQKEMTKEMLEEKYPKYRESYKWQLIERKLTVENDVKVTEEEVRNYIRDYFMKNYFSNFNADSVQERLNTLVNDVLKNKEDAKNIYDKLFDNKLEAILREKMKIDKKSGSFEDFIQFITPGSEPKAEKKSPSKPKVSKSGEKSPSKVKTAAKKSNKKSE